jgi:hypothetical protein
MFETRIARHLDALRQKGALFFTDSGVSATLQVPAAELAPSMARLEGQGDIVSPHAGFFLFAKDGRPGLMASSPYWIHGLMGYLGIRYRVSLLSGARFYGASHQACMCTQVIVPVDLPDIQNHYTKVSFIRQPAWFFAKLNRKPWITFRRKILMAASPELTLFDLVYFARKRRSETWYIAQIVKDMGEVTAPRRLCELAGLFPSCDVRRLGYFFDLAGLTAKADALRDFVTPKSRYVKLNPRVLELSTMPHVYDKDEAWKIILNDDVEYDI